MEKAKKLVTILTIITTSIASLLLIMLLFSFKPFGDSNGNVIITFACLAVGGFFTINSLNMLERNKVLGWISFSLIVLSVLLIILTTWVKFDNSFINNFVIVLGLLSVLFTIIVSSGLELGRTKLVIQIIVYIVVGVTCIFFSLMIFGVIDLLDKLIWLVSLIILSVLGIIILKVLAKKTVNDYIKQDKDMVRISKEEYQMLVEKSAKYDELMSKKQQDQQNQQN
ncbi:MAG: hypothetical protein ACI4PF_02670 [Christensenellales bacterium]